MSRRSSLIVRRAIGLLLSLAIAAVITYAVPKNTGTEIMPSGSTSYSMSPASEALTTLAVKGRAPKTGYARDQYGSGWGTLDGCDTRQTILRRDLTDVVLAADGCTVESGTLLDPYTGKTILFKRGTTSSAVQIDHVSALGDTWQKGAQVLDAVTRESLANDPLELLAVDGSANQQKSDGDAATWLPPNKAFRCYYVARQIAVKMKYHLWVTQAEKEAIQGVLNSCPDQKLPQ